LASKKDKYLESAQRFMLKGQLDRAIKDYQQVVALEPKEIRYRQKLAELLVKDSRKEEAIVQYADIGKHYAENSYFLKAIAVYKQIQRLAPGNTDISLLLASLNHKQGLIGNALAEYGQVVAQLEKSGAFSDAVKVIDQMLNIDGEQVSIRLKHAELLFASGAEETSYQAFRTLINSLRERGDAAAVRQVSERMAKLFPKVSEQNLERVSEQLAAGEVDQAIASLQQWLKRDGRDLQAWQLLCEAQIKKGDLAAARVSHRQMLELFPDSLGVVKGAIRCELQAGESEKASALLERHLPRFVERGESLTAEELLQGVPAAVADSLKDSDWLKRFYEASASGGAPAADTPSAFPSAFASAVDPTAMELELPAGFGAEPAEAFPALSADPATGFGSAWQSEPAGSAEPVPPQGEELPLPWEEEIPLDLDGDFDADLAPACEIDLSGESPLAGPLQEPAQAPLDDLSFLAPDAPPSGLPSEPAPPESSLELTLPDDSEAFPDFDWSDPVEESAVPESHLELDHFVELEHVEEIAEPEPVERVEEMAELEPFEEVEHVAALDPFDDVEEVAAPEPAGHLVYSDEVEPAEDLAEGEEPEPLEHLEEVDAVVGDWEEFEAPEEVSEPEAPSVEPLPAAPRRLRGWEEIYPEALPSDAPIDAGDLYELESHYDLGLGYKEMGMYAGAIKELDVAAINPQRRLACLTLQAMCYREKGEADKARELLERGLDLEVLSDEERMTLSYELAALHESSGELEQAIVLYRQVHSVDPAFGDVGNRLFQLTGEEPLDIIELDDADL
jgi:pilus assembly protein FimV